MKSAHFPFQGGGGGRVTFFLMLGTAQLLLPSDVAGDIQCYKRSVTDTKCYFSSCCFYTFAFTYPDASCGKEEEQCKSPLLGKCVWDREKGRLTCTCAFNLCNDEKRWLDDPEYKAYQSWAQDKRHPTFPTKKPGPGESGSKAAVSAPSALLVVLVVAALGSIPHLVTAL